MTADNYSPVERSVATMLRVDGLLVSINFRRGVCLSIARHVFLHHSKLRQLDSACPRLL